MTDFFNYKRLCAQMGVVPWRQDGPRSFLEHMQTLEKRIEEQEATARFEYPALSWEVLEGFEEQHHGR